jgi:hypothetical protein
MDLSRDHFKGLANLCDTGVRRSSRGVQSNVALEVPCYRRSVLRHRAKCSTQDQLCRFGKIGYGGHMTKLLEKALEAVRRLPPDSQDEIARHAQSHGCPSRTGRD